MIQEIRIRHVSFACGFIKADGEVAWKFRNEKTKGRFVRFDRFWPLPDCRFSTG